MLSSCHNLAIVLTFAGVALFGGETFAQSEQKFPIEVHGFSSKDKATARSRAMIEVNKYVDNYTQQMEYQNYELKEVTIDSVTYEEGSLGDYTYYYATVKATIIFVPKATKTWNILKPFGGQTFERNDQITVEVTKPKGVSGDIRVEYLARVTDGVEVWMPVKNWAFGQTLDFLKFHFEYSELNAEATADEKTRWRIVLVDRNTIKKSREFTWNE